MKTNNKQETRHANPLVTAKPAGNKPRPEIRDNMDSRHRKPENYKGDNSHKNDKPRKEKK